MRTVKKKRSTKKSGSGSRATRTTVSITSERSSLAKYLIQAVDNRWRKENYPEEEGMLRTGTMQEEEHRIAALADLSSEILVKVSSVDDKNIDDRVEYSQRLARNHIRQLLRDVLKEEEA